MKSLKQVGTTSSKKNPFYNNHLYKLLTTHSIYSDDLLQQINTLLHTDPDLATLNHIKEGSYFHIICRNSHGQENIAFRMIYALSNAGADPNVINHKGNTPLHEAFIRGFADTGLDFIQALFRVGVDPRIINHEGKTADAYIENNPQLTILCQDYGDGIWAAIEASNIQEVERLILSFIKVDCKHNTNKTLLDKARDLDCSPIINILADNQVTNEFIHSIFACDWDRASIIYNQNDKFLKLNSFDSIHRLTCIHSCSKSLLEYCLDINSSKPFEILFQSTTININVNILCTDGLPFFFHCFDDHISPDIRKNILFHSNMYTKSSKGETFLFHLINLYCKNENQDYLNVFKNILYHHPLLITQRNQNEQTIIEYIEFTTSMIIYERLKPFYNMISAILTLQLKKNVIIEEFILNHFGYYLLIFFQNKNLQMKTYVYNLLCSLQSYKGLPVLILDVRRAIKDNNIIKLKQIFTRKPIVFYAKDSFGRRCTHLVVLYQRYNMLKFICDNYQDLINVRDNLNRTCYHYACIIDDKQSIEILEQYRAEQIMDCMNFYPKDYLTHRDLCSEQFYANDFLKMELEKTSFAISNYLKLAFYPNLKKFIKNDSIEDIKSINKKIMQMGFHIKDLNPNASLNDYVQGERYIPLLFLAIEYRSIATIKYFIELDVPLTGKIETLGKDSTLKSFQTRLDQPLYLDIMDKINSLEDNDELKDLFKQYVSSKEKTTNEAVIEIEQENNRNIEKTSQLRNKLKDFLKVTEQNENEKSKTCILL